LASLKEEEIELRLRGKSWAVYWYVLGKGAPVTVREVQRSLNLSSPSISLHHLEVLRDVGLIDRMGDTTTYFLKKAARIGPLRNFVYIGGRPLPRFLFYAFFLTVLLAVYLIFFFRAVTRESALFLAFGGLSLIFTWYEVYRAYKSLPF